MTEAEFKAAVAQFVADVIEDPDATLTWFGDTSGTGISIDGYVDFEKPLRAFLARATADLTAQLEKVVDATGYDGQEL